MNTRSVMETVVTGTSSAYAAALMIEDAGTRRRIFDGLVTAYFELYQALNWFEGGSSIEKYRRVMYSTAGLDLSDSAWPEEIEDK